MSLLELQGLSVAYGQQQIFQDVSLTIPPGTFTGLVGPSGCGKTTLALAILGLLPKTAQLEGRILFQGENILGRQKAYRGRKIALIVQNAFNSLNPVLPIGRQIGEILEFHRGYPRAQAQGEARGFLEEVGLSPSLATAYPHALSGGMQQRVCIAMALAGSPQLLIADEPTSGLDLVNQVRILKTLLRLKKEHGLSLLLISHDPEVVQALCDQTFHMIKGTLSRERNSYPMAQVVGS
ncbi:MAG: ATP-binding cassette domain-containing protein [Limnochordia bacterium]|jgi:ABC-type glutathione transport system ATPase component